MKILITGGAGFIGSNLVDHFLEKGHQVVVLDNLATGFEKNIYHHYGKKEFRFIKGDIRDLETCRKAVKGCDGVLHQAALGSVPRSINDPVTSNEVNVSGFINMLVATRDEGIQRFVYAASSSTYGDSKEFPKVEERIGKPLSPYAVTKYVNELYADVFARTYRMQCIGLRYFNVFGRRQDPNGAYAAVIPLWVKAFLNHQSPVINGDGSYSRDFTYIENVIQANEKALLTHAQDIIERKKLYEARLREEDAGPEVRSTEGVERPKGPHTNTTEQAKDKNFPSSGGGVAPEDSGDGVVSSFHEVFNIAYGENTTLLKLFDALKQNLARFDEIIATIEPDFREFRVGDIPHSLANIEKAKATLEYKPLYSAANGFEKACEWYWQNLK
ncbi:SDR family NAD(P)-dependent oxidoreductase [Maribellus comscasis]|uniref:SDR family NAD(P)-dependent oxidoreductase n=1 Tax=Maribellus comscasis TaxID=2681766 RepID=UPI001C2DC518|nr:SDR family NAD(P)-dependent oxidoreductase [Maribellus comscasis]